MNASKIILSVFLLFAHLIAIGQDDLSSSPYFFVQGADATSGFPLLSTDVDVNIVGPIADVTVMQAYHNDGDKPIEAIYVFPASTRAAVYAMEMHIGDRIISATIQEKQKARLIYNRAKEQGKRASLLEQERPNVFQMNVANIMPGEKVNVVMKYTEFLIPEDQLYSFHFPTVVGPRYTGEESAEWAAQAYTSAGASPAYRFDINVRLSTSVPVASLHSPSHDVTTGMDRGVFSISLDDKATGGDRDYIIEYSLSSHQIETGVQTFSSGEEDFFLCQMEAPSLDASPEISPREYIFVVDVSGSMSGYPLQVSKQLMKNLFGNLRPSDKFNILFFAGSAFALSEQSISATEENVVEALAKVDNKRGGGGTNMLGAIKKAMAVPKSEGYSRSFVIVTDGYVSVEERAFDYVQTHLEDSNFFAFGIGSSVNRHLIEGLAHVGRARPFIVTDHSAAHEEAERLRKYIEYPVLSDIKISGQGVELYDLVPDHVPDLMAGRPIYFFGKYKSAGNAQIEITGQNGSRRFYEKLNLTRPEEKNSALAQLWARETIRHLHDYNSLRADQKKIDKITSLGLKYNLLTAFTSFVAVDDEVVNRSNTSQPVKQVLPMPQGVSNMAIGFEMEIEDLTSHGQPTKRLDISIKAEDEVLADVAEILLEMIVVQGDLKIEDIDRVITVKTDKEGKIAGVTNAQDEDIIRKLIAALQSYGLSIKRLDFAIIIKVSK